MTARTPLVFGSDGIPQQLQAGDTLARAAAPGANADITSLGALSVPLSGFRNKLINPGFRVNQRGPTASGATLAAGVYGHDRWKGGTNGCTYTTNAAPGGISTYANITAGTLVQVVEAAAVDGSPQVLAWGGTAVARVTYTASGASSATTTAYAASPILIPAQSPGTAITVEFYFNGSGGTIILPQLEQGTIPTPPEFRPYAVECLLCYRYFRVFPYRVSPYFSAQAGSVYQYLYFDNDADFRVTPSIASYNDDQGTAGQVAYLSSAGGVLSRGSAYSAAAETIRRINVTAYTTSRNAHGCSVTATAEL